MYVRREIVGVRQIVDGRYRQREGVLSVLRDGEHGILAALYYDRNMGMMVVGFNVWSTFCRDLSTKHTDPGFICLTSRLALAVSDSGAVWIAGAAASGLLATAAGTASAAMDSTGLASAGNTSTAGDLWLKINGLRIR